MGNSDQNLVKLLRLWGKTDRNNIDPQVFHPAIYHMLDVGNVALIFLTHPSAVRVQNILTDVLNQKPEELLGWLPWLISMHDIGKISTAFQVLDDQQLVRLELEKFTVKNTQVSLGVRHQMISQVYFSENLPDMAGCPQKFIQAWAEIVGGHHGHYQHPDQDIKMARRALSFEPVEWAAYRETTDKFMRSIFMQEKTVHFKMPANISTAIMAMTGFLILCDWIGSDNRYFRPEPEIPIEEYIGHSHMLAEKAVSAAGLLMDPHSSAPTQVEELFADLGTLRPLQLAVNTIPSELLKFASLTIIEAPTGEGKTETALALAHRIAQETGTEEIYYALPTMATSNQMFGRLQTHLQKRLHIPAAVKLVHGQSFLMESELQKEFSLALVQPLGNGNSKKESDVNETISWFNTKKRALLAPFGVGTIDQAELAALNVKHTALRMMGLVGKTVIIDEVHAYDTYMVTIIERLLSWLAGMNTSVILLSATLPQMRRKQLAMAYGVPLELEDEQDRLYPSLLVLSKQGVFQSCPDVWQPDRVLQLSELHFSDDEAEAKAAWLLNAVKDGGCICWITNTVKRAQRIFEELRCQASSDVFVELLHSQYPVEDRQRRETELTNHYGRFGLRPEKGIVIGTQVLEQSLDLDFDGMVSDLAPIDLLLQRAGRLHRHDRQRPARHSVPRLFINYEISPSGEWKAGSDRKVYAEYIIRQTLKTIDDLKLNQIRLPGDYRLLVESVYSGQSPEPADQLYTPWKDLTVKEEFASGEAHQRLLPLPHPRDSFALESATRITYEEDEGRADWIVAQTRLGEKSIHVIPVERTGNFAILPDGEKIDVNTVAALEIQRKLLKRSLRIGIADAIEILERKVLSEKYLSILFRESPLLKGFYPLWLKDGLVEFRLDRGVLRISLDDDLGLKIVKEV